MKILLTYSGTDKDFKNFEAVPPLGIVAVYSKLPAGVRDETYFLDGNLVGTGYIQDWIHRNKPKIVGIGALTFGYQNAMEIGKAAKDSGAMVVLGGRHATDLRENILREMRLGTRPFDYLVSGEGESRFAQMATTYLLNGSMPLLPNVFSRASDLSSTAIPEVKFGIDTEFPVLDYSMLKGESAPTEYMKKLGKIGLFKQIQISMPIITQRGCAYMGKAHCKFCSIPDVNPKIAYGTFEKSLENLVKQTQADHVWITEGTFTSNLNHMREVAKRVRTVKERTGKDFMFYCFARADNLLRDGVINTLKDMNVKQVFVGYEHADNDLLVKMQKNTTEEENLAATIKLDEAGIEVPCAGLVLGTPPETRATLQKTVDFARKLSGIGNVRSIFASPVYPFSGAPYWPEFLGALEQADSGFAKYLRNTDILPEELLVEQFHRVAHLMPGGSRQEDRPTLDEILETRKRINEILGQGIEFSATS